MQKVILAILFMQAIKLATAGEVWITPYFHTYHAKYEGTQGEDGVWRKFKDVHPSLLIEVLRDKNRTLMFGGYKDSLGGTALFIAQSWKYGRHLRVNLGLAASHSYTYNAIPIVGPEVSLPAGDIKISLGWGPSFGVPRVPDVYTLRIAYKINLK